jgi:PhnB protein
METERFLMPDGTIGQAEVRLGDSTIMVCKEKDEDYKPMPTGIYLYVENCDGAYTIELVITFRIMYCKSS